jgi:hypothetical protein
MAPSGPYPRSPKKNMAAPQGAVHTKVSWLMGTKSVSLPGFPQWLPMTDLHERRSIPNHSYGIAEDSRSLTGHLTSFEIYIYSIGRRRGRCQYKHGKYQCGS